MVTEQQINAFSLFAKSRIEGGATTQSLVELLDEWMVENPSSDDRLAIQASLHDMEAGETGKEFGEFAAEFRAKNGLSNSQ
jgi:hypothetical protein